MSTDAIALRFCLARLLPAARERTIAVDLPPMGDSDEALAALVSVPKWVATGEVTPSEGQKLQEMLERQRSLLRSEELQGHRPKPVRRP